MDRAEQICVLREEIALLEQADELVTVTITRPLAWLLRDMIGTAALASKAQKHQRTTVSFQSDMLRLNEALGYRNDAPNRGVSAWSRRAAEKALSA